MAGLFGGLFGKKSKDATPQTKATVESGFYLDGDDAKSLGDAQRFVNMEPVKKSFPKTSFGETVQVSTPKAKTETLNASSTTVSNALTGSSLSSEGLERRRADSSLDMFRNLARDINKS